MYGYVAERQFGRIKFCIILLLAGYASNLMSYLIYPYHVTVGSYGIIYGVLVIYGDTILTQQLGMYKKLVIGIYCVIFGINFIPLIGIN
jgi:membrane associated rhomboid family serine protease